MAEDDYDIIMKIVLVGDSGVGKSNIFSRYLKNEFTIENRTTVGVEFGAKKIKIGDMRLKVQIWDTAGQERYKSITNAYYKGAKGALLVFDISKRESFTNINKWIDQLKMNGESDLIILLIGNKVDLEHERQVSVQEAEEFAKEKGKISC